MAFYLFRGSYSSASTKNLLDHPNGRFETVAHGVESAGGKLHHLFFAFGDDDVFALAEFPTPKAAAAMALAIGATGAMSKFSTTVLLTPEEAVEAQRLAGKVTYSKPS